mgnify:CR=1 FL=1
MKKKFTWFAIFGFLLICLFSCSTLQEDVEVYMASEEQAPEIRAIEQELVFLEVSYLLDSTSISSSQTDEIIKKLFDYGVLTKEYTNKCISNIIDDIFHFLNFE